jgi:membrane-associated phospholipid phosphatase
MLIISKVDERLSSLVARLPAAFAPLMHLLTYIGEPLIVLTAGFSAYVLSLSYDHPGVQRALLYSVFAFMLCVVLKILLHRRRPYGLIVKNLGIQSYSFPSGHAFGAVIFYGQFAYLAATHAAKPWNIIIAILVWLGVFLIGLSRIYLNYHYPSDVIAGWILGGLSLIIVTMLAY